ncbi:DUF1877 family protein [Micromonospora sp. NPDC005215]|uniref:DUF1877 family protein n=1 Tax=Micromonospora sp. NPDC005215 TaxID=3157024 RepID=UPI0033B29CA2
MLLFGDLDDEDAEMPDPELDLHKSWHALHYLLAGKAREVDDPAAAAVLGGDDIGEEGGYGPPRLLDVETVRVVAAALDMLWWEVHERAELKGKGYLKASQP